jgi:hypothetical protein
MYVGKNISSRTFVTIILLPSIRTASVGTRHTSLRRNTAALRVVSRHALLSERLGRLTGGGRPGVERCVGHLLVLGWRVGVGVAGCVVVVVLGEETGGLVGELVEIHCGGG